jgi:uncharacterized protein
LLTPAERQSLTETLKAHEEATGNQVVVVTLRSLQGTPIEDYGYQLGRFWGIGRQGKDNGVLLIVAPTERKVRIEVGYGLEGALTDATSRAIIERIMAPAFRSGQFGPGIVAGVGAILEVISSEGGPLPHQRTIGADRSTVGLLPAILIFGGFILFMWLVYRGQGSSYYASPGRRRGTWIGYRPWWIWWGWIRREWRIRGWRRQLRRRFWELVTCPFLPKAIENELNTRSRRPRDRRRPSS